MCWYSSRSAAVAPLRTCTAQAHGGGVPDSEISDEVAATRCCRRIQMHSTHQQQRSLSNISITHLSISLQYSDACALGDKARCNLQRCCCCPKYGTCSQPAISVCPVLLLGRPTQTLQKQTDSRRLPLPSLPLLLLLLPLFFGGATT